MSENTNTQIVQDAYQRFSSGDIAGLLTLLSQNIEWTVPEIENAPFAGKREGVQAVGEFFKELSAAEEITRFEPLEFIAQNNRVVVLGVSSVTVRETGRTYETEWVHVFLVRDGNITEFTEYFDTAAATKAFQKTAAA
jgi:ketosteroid isomerase-like protein